MTECLIQIRPYDKNDEDQIEPLVRETIYSINVRDYSIEQVQVWADQAKKNRLNRPLENSYAYVAVYNKKIVGFGDIDKKGYLDRLYVHKDFQRQGIARQLLKTLEARAKELGLNEISVDVSLTAKSFFLANGYRINEACIVSINNISLSFYRMCKSISV